MSVLDFVTNAGQKTGELTVKADLSLNDIRDLISWINDYPTDGMKRERDQFVRFSITRDTINEAIAPRLGDYPFVSPHAALYGCVTALKKITEK